MSPDPRSYGTFPVTTEAKPPCESDVFTRDPRIRAALKKHTSKLSFYEGLLCCAGTMLLFSQIPTAFTFLHERDSQVFTACNVLCGSTIVGLVFLPLLFHQELPAIYADMMRLTPRESAMIMLSAFLFSAVGPFLQFAGLERTSVETLAVLQRLETVNLLVISGMAGEHLSRWSAVNALCLVLIVLSYAVTMLVGRGNLIGPTFILLCGWCNTASLVVTRRELAHLRPGLVAIGRTFFGFVSYHTFAVVMGFEDSLSKVYSIDFWSHMAWYGLLYVAAGQYLWTLALQNCTPSTLGVGMTSLFPLQILWSCVLQGAPPSPADLLFALLLLVVVLSGAVELIVCPPPVCHDLLTHSTPLVPCCSQKLKCSPLRLDEEGV
eukprot:TRINITY_DN29670_c0_g1_i1.p1 TRINITY_DN29670_c0_g1~~TRINITY_DN29670_c0_g1_i1.p1  ORF type:complete len:378 (+),score=82.81 TRINITY_DN29670_c0_g1_i1:39-1172(+)